jgi:hypothetical protein
MYKSTYSDADRTPEILDKLNQALNLGFKNIEDLANQIRKEYVHKLGNLTLTGYNSNLGNLSLSKKQDRKNNEGKYIGYKNGLILNNSIMDTTNWSKEKIEDRTNYLVEKSLNIFKL